MNKTLSTLMISFALWLAAFATAQAVKGPPDIRNTVHNLSSGVGNFNVQYKSSNEDEVCIFCHTPHGGSLTGPLWNRANTTTTYTHYSSAGASAYLRGLSVNRPVSNESMLCLSCHDGSITVQSILNTSNRTGGQPESFWDPANGVKITALDLGFVAATAAKIGASLDAGGNLVDVSTDLMDDHPISFLYESVRAQKPDEFKTVATAEAAGVRFFPQTAADGLKRVECSSCHDPHVDYFSGSGDAAYTPFLITPNDGSKLCLACHTK